MYPRLETAATLVAACVITVAALDRPPADGALQRASLDWDRGDYISALTAYQDLLAGADAAAVLEPIALQTGELFRTTELTADGANPEFSPDALHFAFETGPAVSAGTAAGAGRMTHVRTTAAPARDITTLDGGDASFCPDGRRVAFLRVPTSPEITAAQAAVGSAVGGGERAARQQTLARLIARAGRVVVRDIDSGQDEELSSGDLLKTGVTCAADGTILVAGAAETDTASTEIYAVRAGQPPQALTRGDGVRMPLEIDAAGRTLLFTMPRLSPFRQPAGEALGGGGGRGGGGGFGAAPSAFGIVTLDGKSATVNGFSPALSRDGRSVAWVSRSGAPAADAEQRLLVASTDNTGAPVDLHKGTERLDAPALSADGARVAFQMMPNEDWEIYVVNRDGSNETRVTREIQHDLLPRFLDRDRLLGVIGEPRHRRSFVYTLSSPAITRTRLFHNNTVRTIAPEYAWVPAADGLKVLVLAERDGDTVSPARGVYLMDLSSKVTLDELKARVAANLRSERALKENGRRLFAPIAPDVAKLTSQVSAAQAYRHEKALFDFDSKHITKPGNKLASEYLFNAYASFGYTPEYQWFSPRGALGGRTANVIATLRGTVNPELVYVVSSHYDSVAVGPGADDDTSGTAALLETARVLAGHPMPATIVFASFTGEEAGLLGSREFVRRAVESRMKIVGALNNDMVGWANDNRLDDTIRYSNPGIRDI
jgi:hypothetical protein